MEALQKIPQKSRKRKIKTDRRLVADILIDDILVDVMRFLPRFTIQHVCRLASRRMNNVVTTLGSCPYLVWETLYITELFEYISFSPPLDVKEYNRRLRDDSVETKVPKDKYHSGLFGKVPKYIKLKRVSIETLKEASCMAKMNTIDFIREFRSLWISDSSTQVFVHDGHVEKYPLGLVFETISSCAGIFLLISESLPLHSILHLPAVCTASALNIERLDMDHLNTNDIMEWLTDKPAVIYTGETGGPFADHLSQGRCLYIDTRTFNLDEAKSEKLKAGIIEAFLADTTTCEFIFVLNSPSFGSSARKSCYVNERNGSRLEIIENDQGFRCHRKLPSSL